MFILLALCRVVPPAFAEVPRVLDYQGRLADPGGAPVADASYNVSFRLYEAPEGGTAVWTENQSVATQNGLFSAVLGSVAPLDALVFDRPYYLGIDVNSAGELTPRVQLTAASYSLNAAQLDGQGPEAFAAASHTHGGADITDGSVGSADIADGSIGSAEIADGSVGSADLEDGSVGSAEIADGSIANADVSPTAAIAGTKIAPDFGAQTVVTTGSLGVGTAAPAYPVHVVDTGVAYIGVEVGSGSQNAWFAARNPDRTWISGVRGTVGDNYSIYDLTANLSRLEITPAGNVGLGTTTPAYKLQVQNSTSTWPHLHLGTADGQMTLGANNPGQFVIAGGRDANGNNVTTHATQIHGISGTLRFFADDNLTAGAVFNPAERMRITTAGNVGIGTTAPETELHVNDTGTTERSALTVKSSSGTTPTSGDLLFAGTGVTRNSGGSYNLLRLGVGAGYADTVLTVTGNGLVGINTDSPAAGLDVNGNAVRVRTARTPASSSEACNQGEISWDANFVYVCVAANTWKRAALSSW